MSFCDFHIPEEIKSTLMWIATIVLGIGIVLLFLKRYKKIDIDGDFPPFMILAGFICSVLIGVSSEKKREGFSALYGF